MTGKHILIFLTLFTLVSAFVFGVSISSSTLNFLTKTRADTLYCLIDGMCNVSVLNVENITVFNTFFNASTIFGLNESIEDFSNETYLRLDAKNDPVTGNLELNNNLKVGGYLGINTNPTAGTNIRIIEDDATGIDISNTVKTDYSDGIAGSFHITSSGSTDPIITKLTGIKALAEHGSTTAVYLTTPIIGGEFEAKTSFGGGGGVVIPELIGVNSYINMRGDDATITDAYIFKGEKYRAMTQSIINQYGLYLPSLTGGTNNYAIKTSDGLNSLGDDILADGDDIKVCTGASQDVCRYYTGTTEKYNAEVGNPNLNFSNFDEVQISGDAAVFGEFIQVMPSDGDTPFFLDGATNDYTGVALEALKISRDINTDIDLMDFTFAFENKLASFNFNDKRVGYSIGAIAQPYPTFIGASFDMENNIETPITGGSNNDATYNSVVFQINSKQTFSAENTGAGQFVLVERGLELNIIGGGSDRSSGGGFDYIGKGLNIIMKPNLNSDLHSSEATGLNIEISGNGATIDSATGLKFTSMSATNAYDIWSTSDADSWIQSDSSRLHFGENKNSYIGGDSDSLNINSSLIRIEGDLNIEKDLNQTDGNATINNIYGEMWYHNHTATTINFVVQDTFYPLFFTNATSLNGFTFKGGSGIASNLTAKYAGKYKACYMASGSGQNNHMYFTSVLINGVGQDNCASHKKMAAGGDVTTMNGCCFIDLNIGDYVSLETMDYGSPGMGGYYSANLNLVRSGN